MPVAAVNPTKSQLKPNELALLATKAPQYYQYLMNPEGFDYNTLPTGRMNTKLGGKYTSFDFDYDAIRSELKAQADAKAAAEKAAADQLAAEAAAATKRQTDITSARDIADRTADDAVRDWGLDPTAWEGKTDLALDDLLKSLGDSADPYTMLNGRNLADQVLNNAQRAERNKFTNEANTKFGADYGNKLIGNNLLDDVVADILGEQQAEAQGFLDRGLARGIYNDTGYAAGQGKLGAQAQAGRSQLRTAADDVLQGYRSQADAVRDKAYGAAGGYTLGSTLNLDDYAGQGNAIRDRASEFGAGDLRSTIGGQNFFDFSGLTNAAGMAQGATNLRDSNIAAALAERKNKALSGRGLGSQGVF